MSGSYTLYFSEEDKKEIAGLFNTLASEGIGVYTLHGTKDLTRNFIKDNKSCSVTKLRGLMRRIIKKNKQNLVFFNKHSFRPIYENRPERTIVKMDGKNIAKIMVSLKFFAPHEYEDFLHKGVHNFITVDIDIKPDYLLLSGIKHH